MKSGPSPSLLFTRFVRASCIFTPALLLGLLQAPAPDTQQLQAAKRRPLIIAHRGGADEFTENTIAGFQRAVELGADGIETDLRLTRDGVVVVYHDERFGRVEGLHEKKRTRRISSLTYSELSRQSLVPVGVDTGGQRVPKLDELLSQVSAGLLNIELKASPSFDRLLSLTIAALRRFPGLDRVVLEVHSMQAARKLRAEFGSRLRLHINPDLGNSVPYEVALRRVLKFKPHSISVSYKRLSRSIVEQAHEAGVEVWVWTVNSTEIAEAMRLLGVDAIKTDKPTTMLELFR